MTSIIKSFLKREQRSYIRPFDIRRDLEEVVNLVELCFRDTLDESGRRYLRRMRGMAQNPTLLRFTSLTSEWVSSPLSGYVWTQDNRLVGNVSLIPYTVNRRRNYLIANVAVHPDYRRRGIARSLTEQALARARMSRISSVWLHVRQENQAAIELYHNLGFIERTRRTNWVDDPQAGLQSLDMTEKIRIEAAKTRHWISQRSWLGNAYPSKYSWHMPARPYLLRPGLFGVLLRTLSTVDVKNWAALQGDHLAAVLSAHTVFDKGLDLWLAAPQDGNPAAVGALLAYARYRSLPRQRLYIEYPAGYYDRAIEAAGFRQQQTLIWMSLST